MTNGESKIDPNESRVSMGVDVGDGQLLARFNAGQDERGQQAFAALVARHGPMVLRVCHQILGERASAEDAFQATFLVLARKSGTIRRPELLANWLYGVALRTAWEAKMRDGQRRRRELSTAENSQGEPATEGDRPELAVIGREEFQVLHEEVSRLPERYRLPVVLCELEGLSYQEAAERLRCPIGTIGVRLSRARERLRVRMIRRGIVPGAALAAAMLSGSKSSAAMSPALAQATVRAAAGFAASDAAAAGLVTTSVLSLTRAVLKVMALARFEVATQIVLLVAFAATAARFAIHWPAPVALAAESARLEPATATEPPALISAAAPARPAPASNVAERSPVAQANVVNGVLIEHLAATPNVDRQPDPVSKVVLPARKKRILDEQARGELLFTKEWVPDDPMSHGGDGLGPVYNETSCVACHGLGSPGGAGPESKNVVIVSALATTSRALAKKIAGLHPGLGNARSTVLHRFGTDPAYASWRRVFTAAQGQGGQTQGAPRQRKGESVDEHMQRIAAQTVQANRVQERTAPLTPIPGITLTLSERNTPALFGTGQIDSIPSAVLIEEAAQQPTETRGRVSRDAKGRVGRFGWKAQIANLHEFVRSACAGELGLEVPEHAQAASPVAPNDRPAGLDMTEEECDDLVAYVRRLPAPVVVDPTGPRGTAEMADGRRLLTQIGCTDCHTASLGSVRGIYSDLLLHDMGPSLSDSGMYYGGGDGPFTPGGPLATEWRTPPLWGFRDSGPYLHDGRARTLEEAVALHGGQGTTSAKRFFKLAARDQFRIEAFLKSLVAPAAIAAPGLILASELESRVEPDDVREAEAEVRKQRAKVAAREERKHREAERRKLAELTVKRAQNQLPIAVNLEKSGKIAGALEFYRAIARDAPDTVEGRIATIRIDSLEPRSSDAP
jgi:RNA polymerase sigma factor (sigma-70 family)